MSSTSKFKYFFQVIFIFVLVIQFAESLKCCQNNVNEAKCAKTCVGERCLKLISPGGRTLRQCITGYDPEYNFAGYKHNDDGEDAYICSNEDNCNSATIPFLSGSLLIPLFIYLLSCWVH
uniref:Uncharacterized protein n=1 Tax=Panagrolaimus sp. PS1159 TaxID=55785 RepID=A0AC35FYJ1_9BILA